MKPSIAIPATAALVYRAWSRNSLTPFGIVTATATAIAHALHPWSVFFALLCVFFLTGTAVTKVKHDVKSRITHSSSGTPGGEGPRNHIQVLANSAVASVLILLHTWMLYQEPHRTEYQGQCWPRDLNIKDIVVVGIVANYVAVAADTFSSELGILSSRPPRLITAPWRIVPRGTNGGVTMAGLVAGLLGSFVVAVTAALLLPFCPSTILLRRTGTMSLDTTGPGWDLVSKFKFITAMTFIGLCGSLLDSLLGAVLQASVVDVRTGIIIEGEGGGKIAVSSRGSLRTRQRTRLRSPPIPGKHSADGAVLSEDETGKRQPSRRVEYGRDILSNNGVNFVMAAMISVSTMIGAGWLWHVF